MSPFELMYGMKPKLLSFPIPDLTRISYEEAIIAERLQLLTKARQSAIEPSIQAGDSYKKNHDAKAKSHDLVEGDYAYLDNHLFFGKNIKFAQR
jgi:hypothetical protein